MTSAWFSKARRGRGRALAAAAAVALALPVGARAQQYTKPDQRWRTIQTPHFLIAYPQPLEEWARTVARHIEGVREAVVSEVGFAPGPRTTIIVDDPLNASNGLTFAFQDHPAIILWTTSPEPRQEIAHMRSWPEILSVHEFTHVAHLTRPARDPLHRLLTTVAPFLPSVIARRTPRWATEGYATYVEGKLTGSGRPFGVYRPALLRQWALEGTLPSYGALNGTEGYLGGSMAYLIGSAYLEWLAERSGESKLTDLWRRLTAVQQRTFTDAFAGVFGGTPEALYDQFTVDVTARALAARADLASAGIISGDTVQRLAWATGDPALSPNDSLMAIRLASGNGQSRIVIWKTATPPDTTSRRAAERLRQRDPEDVPAIRWRPPPKRAIATLYPVAGMAHDNPRFLPDGKRVLLTRLQAQGDGRWRYDLFIWDFVDGGLRRVTHGAGIRSADPSPDGRFAAGDRCAAGRCDLVRVDLATGIITTLAVGSPTVSYYRPRYSPDGRTIAVAVQREGRWRIGLVDAGGGPVRLVDPDDGVDRYDVDFMPDARALVLTSERGGIANLERLDPVTRQATPLTRVTSAAYAPEPDSASGRIYFLRLHARGLDLASVPADSSAGEVVALDPALAPAAERQARSVPDSFPANPVPSSHAYGLGPPRLLVAPVGTSSAEGQSAAWLFGGIAVTSIDPVGRLTLIAQGIEHGDPGIWKGWAFGASWRGFWPEITGELFTTRHHPSRQKAGDFAPPSLDVNYRGGALYVSRVRDVATSRTSLRLGGSMGTLDGPAFRSDRRSLALAELSQGVRRTRGAAYLSAAAAAAGYAGSTAGDAWRRGIFSANLRLGVGAYGLVTSARYGVVERDAPAFESFTLGGAVPPLFDPALLSQIVSMPALPFALASGRVAGSYRVALDGAGFEPYFWGGSAGGRIGSWHRVVGLESDLTIPGIPIVRLAETRVRAGAGYSLDEPFRHKLRFYLTTVLRP